MALTSRRFRNLLDPSGWPTQTQPPEDTGWFTLSKPVGPDVINDNADVAKVESLLGHVGVFDTNDGPTGWYGRQTADAIKDFQKQNGLEVDGLLNPGGPTITALKRQVGTAFTGFNPPTKDQIEAHHVDLKQGGTGLLTFGPTRVTLNPIDTLPSLSGDEYSANTRTLDSLRRYSTDGEMPRWIAADIVDRGANGVARARDLVERMKASDPKRGEGLAGAIYDALNGPHKAAFTGGNTPSKPPAGVLVAEAYPNLKLAHSASGEQTPAPTPEPAQPPAQPPEPTPTPAPPPTSQPMNKGEPHVVADPDKFLRDHKGQKLDDGKGGYSGECVSAVKRAAPGIGRTAEWKEGAKINETDKPELKPGTVVATFKDGQYQGDQKHAAIFMGYGEKDGKQGMRVIDQHKNKPVGESFIPFDSSKNPQGNAGAYSAVIK